MRESKIEKDVCSHATRQGVKNFKLNGPGDRGKPDRLFLFPGGYVLFIEFKATGETPTKLQRKNLRELRLLGFDARWTDNIEEGIEFINEIIEI